METRANHFIVGAFVLGLIAAAFGFVHWMGRQDLTADVTRYRILFHGSVAGLRPAGDVLFNGIKVGKIDTVAIYAPDPRQSEVMVSVQKGVPVREDSLASIAQVGITGLSAVQISAGTPNQPLATIKQKNGFADIKTNAALSGSVMDAMPELLANVNAFFVRLNQLVASNEDTLQKSLASLASFTAVLDSNKDELDKTLNNVNAITESFRTAAARLQSTIERIDGDLSEDDESIVVQAKKTMVALRGIAEKLNKTIDGNAEKLTQTATHSFQELAQLAKDGRRVVRGLDRLLEKVDRDPQSLLFGSTTVKPYQPQ